MRSASIESPTQSPVALHTASPTLAPTTTPIPSPTKTMARSVVKTPPISPRPVVIPTPTPLVAATPAPAIAPVQTSLNSCPTVAKQEVAFIEKDGSVGPYILGNVFSLGFNSPMVGVRLRVKYEDDFDRTFLVRLRYENAAVNPWNTPISKSETTEKQIYILKNAGIVPGVNTFTYVINGLVCNNVIIDLMPPSPVPCAPDDQGTHVNTCPAQA